MTINEYMTTEHRKCDDEFANFENAIDKDDWDNASGFFERFKNMMLRHFAQEEQVMFDEYNNCEGGHCNPTGVMIMEHNQMRAIFDQISNSILAKDKDSVLGLCENLMFLMQQHNMKEEQIMYNLADDSLDAQTIISKMEAIQ